MVHSSKSYCLEWSLQSAGGKKICCPNNLSEYCDKIINILYQHEFDINYIMGDAHAAPKYCQYCGDELPSRGEFCSGCGKKQEFVNAHTVDSGGDDAEKGGANVATADDLTSTQDENDEYSTSRLAKLTYWSITTGFVLSFIVLALVIVHGTYTVMYSGSPLVSVVELFVLIAIVAVLDNADDTLKEDWQAYQLVAEEAEA